MVESIQESAASRVEVVFETTIERMQNLTRFQGLSRPMIDRLALVLQDIRLLTDREFNQTIVDASNPSKNPVFQQELVEEIAQGAVSHKNSFYLPERITGRLH
ncbi:hypothetical protein JW766_01600 [Candidatus Dojkabacteria bacterium]|nr:hypothetical protein [Candidatus Dojkabacteria bacterium]